MFLEIVLKSLLALYFVHKNKIFSMQKNDKDSKRDQLSDEIDSLHDQKEMEDKIVNIKIPDAHDIPGQKDFTPAPLGEMADTTISSADEEGDEIFDDNIDEDIKENPYSNVSPTEKEDLRKSANDMPGDDESLRESALDNTDDDGDQLNEGSFKKNVTDSDLDIPGVDSDDEEEEIGEEDEENNDYSLGGEEDTIPEDEF